MANKSKIVIGMRNFRSVQSADLALKPITVLTGANGAGKSSFMYGLMVLKNIVTNSNQSADDFFNLAGIANLGGVKEVVTSKNPNSPILFGISYADERAEASYLVTVGPTSTMRLNVRKPVTLDLRLNVSYPYPLVKTATQDFEWGNKKFKATFNGIGLNILAADGSATDALVREVHLPAITPIAISQACDYVDVRRGFFRNTYAPLGTAGSGEENVASLLANDRDLEAKVSVVLDKMMNKSFSTRHTSLGASTFYLQTTDRNTGFVCDLVNEGFGVNQLIYLLAKVLQKSAWLVAVEEPEAHLHPEALAKMAEQFVVMSKRDNKRFLISSHSEHFVAALLNLIAQGKATPDDVGIYFFAKDENNLTQIAQQEVNEKGQIEGGLRSFYEPSMRALEEFLGPETDREHVNPSK